ncbi:DNAJA2 [Symbiodinium pilosum]|uniref:DNAJA2 protein n=1 Tax=Symbiodinium pilosum TaxID=2952 RepID=A0A812S9J9_SYMPI|nr:DNAJA2 [Symbiodinium pilosum]
MPHMANSASARCRAAHGSLILLCSLPMASGFFEELFGGFGASEDANGQPKKANFICPLEARVKSVAVVDFGCEVQGTLKLEEDELQRVLGYFSSGRWAKATFQRATDAFSCVGGVASAHRTCEVRQEQGKDAEARIWTIKAGYGLNIHYRSSSRVEHLQENCEKTVSRRLTLTFNRIFDHEAVDLDKDLYEVLGLAEDADEASIKKVYRKLSIQYHPDKNPDEASKAKFAEIRDAYEILNDPDKKILYDTGGMAAVKDSEKGKVESTSDVHSEIEVGLEDLYLGTEFRATVKRGVVCRGCRKNPSSPNCKGCRKCKNQIKVVQVQMGPFLTQQQQEVPSKEKCKDIDAPLDVHIEKGMTSGDTVTFPRMAEERPGMLPGSVILKLKAKKHPRFERRGSDLHTDLKISLRESLLGWSRTIQHLDGHEVEIKQSDVTKHLQVLKKRSEGMPHRDDPASFGDMHVKVAVEFPKTLTPQQREAIAQVFAGQRV